MPSWSTSTDWDGAQSESGVAHESVAGSDHNDATIVKQGYAYSGLGASVEGYWPCHEGSTGTLYDVSGNARDGSIDNNTNVNNTGLLGNSCHNFSGTGFLSVPDNAVFDIGSSEDLTVNYWLRASNYNQGANIIGKGDSSGGVNNVWDNIVASSDLRATWQDGGTEAYAYIPHSSVFDGVWHMITMVTDKTNGVGRFYLDGSQQDSVDISSVGDQSNSDNVIMMKRDEDDTHTPGDLCEVSIHSTARSGSYIQSLYDTVNNAGSLTTGAKSW